MENTLRLVKFFASGAAAERLNIGWPHRSVVETKMRCLKQFGERVIARDFDLQVAKL